MESGWVVSRAKKTSKPNGKGQAQVKGPITNLYLWGIMGRERLRSKDEDDLDAISSHVRIMEKHKQDMVSDPDAGNGSVQLEIHFYNAQG
ncbi:acyl-CoA dehydrogenase [Sesbania bispinosa]|nr:acyl-CoA dehydrogenase [Sesbania bispinosa]